MAHERKYLTMARTIGVTGVAFVLNYLITLFLTPYITENVGTEAYGFVTLAKNYAQYATYLTIALNAFSTRYISLAYHKKDFKQANIYFSSTFYGDLILGSAVTVLLLLAVNWLDKLLVIPPEIVLDVKILFLIIFLKFWFTTVFTVYHSGPYISNKLDTIAGFKALSYVAEAVALAAMFYCFHTRLYYVGIGIFVGEGLLMAANIWVCRKYTPKLRVSRKDFRLSAVKTLVLNGIWPTINSMGAFLLNGLDLMVSNLMLSPLAMGKLAIAQSMDTIVKGIYAMGSHAFQPMFLKSYSDNNMPQLLKELKLSMSVSSMLSNLPFAGFFALGLAYYRIWIPNEDIQTIYLITVIIISSCIPSGMVHPLYYIYTLTVRTKIPCFFTLTSGLMNVVSMYFLIKYTSLGIYAVVITTAVLSVLLCLVAHLLYMAHVLKLPWHTFYPTACRNLLSCGVLCLMFKGFAALYTPTRWLTLFLCVAVYAGIGAFVHFMIVLNNSEKKVVLQKVKGFISHKAAK